MPFVLLALLVSPPILWAPAPASRESGEEKTLYTFEPETWGLKKQPPE